ncbi:MAG: DUF1343 domain-containing protein [Breznakibacter sp.]
MYLRWICFVLGIFFLPIALISQVRLGNQDFGAYLPVVKGKNVGVLVNQTSLVDDTHLVDTLMALGVNVTVIFSPEHGFRGNADAGEKVLDGVDRKTGIRIISLYGDAKKPTPQQLQGIDWVLFDIQDVGVRFYTYISSLHLLMEACAEQHVGVVVLDRPNPNGDYVDGPVLDPKFKSFVGMHPIPVVHGLTIGELAQMINGEGWLKAGARCNLKVVKMANYRRGEFYHVAVKPSPNLPNDLSIRLYPSLCFFEGTAISVGRGTGFPFQVAGYPDKRFGSFSFVPESIDGMARQPLHENKICYGLDLRNAPGDSRFTLKYLIDFHRNWGDKPGFISSPRFFNLLAGNDVLQKQILEGMTEAQIRKTWQADIDKYLEMRRKYLIYP